MKQSDVLIAARALIADPAHWCQGASLQRTEDGTMQYCAAGAESATCRVERACAQEYLEIAARNLYNGASIVDVNDIHGHAAVMAVYDAAIALAQADEKGQ